MREPRFRTLRTALSWAAPAAAMVAGAWAAGTLLAAATHPVAPYVLVASGLAAGVAAFGGMNLFERLVGPSGAAMGVGVAFQLALPPLLDAGMLPGWVVPLGWLVTAVLAGVVVRRAHNRQPPVIRTARPVVVTRADLDALVGRVTRGIGSASVAVSGRFRLRGWPRTALQAVELGGNPPPEIDAVVSLRSSSGCGTAFLIRDDGTTADLVTNEHLFRKSRTARVGIAGTVRRAIPLPRPNPARFAQLLADAMPGLRREERAALAEEADLRVVRIDSRGLAVPPLPISTAADGDEAVLSVGYPLGGIPRFVWPANPMPVPVIGIGRLARRAGQAELWSPWRIQPGNSGGPLLVRERGALRVAAVTYLQHASRRSRGDAPHISASVLRAYLAALDEHG